MERGIQDPHPGPYSAWLSYFFLLVAAAAFAAGLAA
jgi:hypothetical protein